MGKIGHLTFEWSSSLPRACLVFPKLGPGVISYSHSIALNGIQFVIESLFVVMLTIVPDAGYTFNGSHFSLHWYFELYRFSPVGSYEFAQYYIFFQNCPSYCSILKDML